MSAPTVAIYGAGRVGLAVARLARARGVVVAGVWNPRPLAPARAALAGPEPPSIAPAPPATPADLWLVTVPDDAIAEVAEALARAAAAAGTVPRAAAHCAGAHGAELLAPLAALGVPCGSWHPATALRGAADDADALASAAVAVEGEPAAVALLEALSAALGVRAFPVAGPGKARYHAALVLASNGRVALDAAAARLLADLGVEPEAARALLGPLVARTEANLAAAEPAEALTGPAARGDARTVAAQLAALAGRPAERDLYRAVARVLVDLVPARHKGAGHAAVERLVDPETESG